VAPDGTQTSGVFDAQTLPDARSALEAMGFTVTNLKLARAGALPATESLLSSPPTDPRYVPLVVTLRLYAGWLLAPYLLAFAFGGLAVTRILPVTVPFTQAILLSPLAITFALGLFLFLLCTSLHREMGGGTLKGIIIAAASIVLTALFAANIA
jgi:hypothetical protein